MTQPIKTRHAMTTKPTAKDSSKKDLRTVVEHVCSFFKGRILASGASASGESGFEGLIAKLLGSLTGQPYVVASSGLQQTGDALDHTGRISIQCKAYFGKNNPTVAQIAGDVNTQIHSNRNVEVYVLALRSLSTQIHSLKGIFSNHGLDFICIQSTAENPDLPCLLARYWNEVASHPLLGNMHPELRQSIADLQTDNATFVAKTLEDLKTRIESASGTYESSRLRALSFLKRRFNLISQRRSPGLFPIDLAQAISRPDSCRQFRDWWQGNSTPILFAEGEEGYGKSWLIAQEAWRIAESEQTFVLWLDSNQWCDSETLRDAVIRAFRYCLGISDTEPDKLDRLYRKLINRWNHPVLLILDGMNEHDCPIAANRIVADYTGILDARQIAEVTENDTNLTSVALPFPIRIVFTTRPLALRTQNPSTFAGEHGQNYSVPPYSSSEYNALLQQSNLSLQDLPTDTDHILRIPRLFATFLRIRKLFAKTQVITPALIWWYDLVKKIEDGVDPAITDGLNLHNPQDAEELLGEIVNRLGTGKTVSHEKLSRLFSRDYLNIRADLKDSRLFTHADRTSATISDDHVILAWGLIIWRLLDKPTSHSILQLADDIHSLFEPSVSDSRRTDGIVVALQLAVAENCNLRDEAIASGLLAWFCSHNIVDCQGQLDYWCQERLSAYRLFVENVLVSTRSGSPERVAVAPLARLWRDALSRESELKHILRRWMLVTWSEGQPANVTEKEWAGIRLPVVSHHHQLRLTPIALSILSQRPAASMLPSIAECYASAHVATALHRGQRFPEKWPHSMLLPLLRWGYTETAVPCIELLRDREPRTEVKEAYQWLISDGMGLNETKDQPKVPSVETAIIEHGDPRMWRRNNAHGWAHGINVLAIRDDLPAIVKDAQAEMVALFTSCCMPDSGGIDRWFFEGLWPWVLKWDSNTFEEACAPPLVKTLTSDTGPNYEILHHFQGFLWQHQTSSIAEAIGTCVLKNRSRLHHGSAEMLLEWLLFHGTPDQLRQYLDQTENIRAERGYLLINLMSTTELLRILKPTCALTLAQQRATVICSIDGWIQDANAVERLEYWLIIWANSTGPSETAADWATGLLAQGCPSQCRADCIRLLARSAASRLPALISDNRTLASCLSDEDFLYMLRYGQLPDCTVRELTRLWAERGSGMVVHRGRLQLLQGNHDGFQTWGHELLQLACRCAEGSDYAGASLPMATCFEVDIYGNVVARAVPQPNSRTTVMSFGSDSWGNDQGRQPNTDVDANAQLDKWRASEEALRVWAGFPLRSFDDQYCLRMWAERYPAEFEVYCNEFFARLLASQAAAEKLGCFPHYLLAVMLRQHPTRAYAYWKRLQMMSSSRVTVFGADLVSATAWRPDLNGTDGIDSIRKSVLLESENDEAIMGLTLNAMRLGTSTELFVICEDLALDALSKVRALAVSALAWLWHDSADTLLSRLHRDDPSCWIREHATWALEVRRQDSACRRAYHKALEMANEYDVSRELHVMKPALLPSCIVWREIEERSAAFPETKCSTRIEALIHHFWYHWDNVSSHRHDTKVLGRQMKEYLCGHKVDRLSETQMAPWWRP